MSGYTANLPSEPKLHRAFSGKILIAQIGTNPAPTKSFGHSANRTTTNERVEDESAEWCPGKNARLDQGFWKSGIVLPLIGLRIHSPDRALVTFPKCTECTGFSSLSCCGNSRGGIVVFPCIYAAHPLSRPAACFCRCFSNCI